MRNPIQSMIDNEVQDGSSVQEALELILSERTGEEFEIWDFVLGEPEFGDFYESDWIQTVQVIGKRFIDDAVELECIEWNVTDVEAEINRNASLMIFNTEAQLKFLQEKELVQKRKFLERRRYEIDFAKREKSTAVAQFLDDFTTLSSGTKVSRRRVIKHFVKRWVEALKANEVTQEEFNNFLVQSKMNIKQAASEYKQGRRDFKNLGE